MKPLLFKGVFTPLYLSFFHIAFIVLMGIFARYKFEYGQVEVPGFMMFVGFGFLMTFLRRYGYSSVGYNFVVAAYVLEWSLLVRGWLQSANDQTAGVFQINILSLLVADFCAAAVLISFGAVIGKASLMQLLIMTTIEVVLQSVNEFIGDNYLKCYDVGESIYVHIFGAYFGLTVSKVLSFGRETESEKEGSTYNSDLFSMIGTLFLFLYWPSFNSATAQDEGQLRAIVNTYLSIAASVLTTFMVSLFVGKGKINMVHVQNATLAGGVAVGAVADMVIQPFGAMIIGSFAGIVSTIGFQFLTPLLNRTFLHDTCGVNNLHGMPGLISGIASAIVAATATRDNFGGNRLYVFYPSRIPVVNSPDYVAYGLATTEYASGGLGRTAVQQGGFQIAGVVLTLGMAIVGGIVTGVVLRLPFVEQITDERELFEDEPNWKVPDDFKEHGEHIIKEKFHPSSDVGVAENNSSIAKF